MHTNENLCRTFNLGLYHRYKREVVVTKNGVRKIKSKEDNPYIFEAYVACVMEKVLGGKAKVTQSSGDYGVDIRHTLPNREIYLGQVKCYDLNTKINHAPISILHSNMVVENAAGGYFITTSDFSENAISRAKELNITLINGYEFAQYCLDHKGSWLEEQKRISLLTSLLNEWDKFYDELRSYIKKRKGA